MNTQDPLLTTQHNIKTDINFKLDFFSMLLLFFVIVGAVAINKLL